VEIQASNFLPTGQQVAQLHDRYMMMMMMMMMINFLPNSSVMLLK